MNCHKIDAVLCVHFDNVNPLVGCDLNKRLVIINNRIINRNGAYHSRAFFGEKSAKFLCIAAGAEVHNSLCAHVNRALHFFKFHVKVLAVPRSAEIDIDFCFKH